MDETGTVVVGVDGSPGSRSALQHALEDASRRRARLRLVAAVPLPEYWATAYGMSAPPPSAETVADVRAEAQRMVDEMVAAHPGIAAGLSIDVNAMPGTPAEVLLEASLGADLLVVGHRGRGAFTSALLGSVGLQCVLRAACPVTVVRPVAAPADPEAVDPQA